MSDKAYLVNALHVCRSGRYGEIRGESDFGLSYRLYLSKSADTSNLYIQVPASQSHPGNLLIKPEDVFTELQGFEAMKEEEEDGDEDEEELWSGIDEDSEGDESGTIYDDIREPTIDE
jgi:hypothetical protein